MDDFNNFFDEPNKEPEREKTPIYHTPEPPKKDNKQATIMGICIIMSVVMCLVIVVNVIVLYSLKNKIAAEYATSLTELANSEYSKAIEEKLADSDIVSDIQDEATKQVVNIMSTEIGKVANNECAPSVARIFLYKNSTDESYSSLATAFLISDSTTSSTERYLVTNAHCARYLKPIYTTTNKGFMGGSYQQLTGYEWSSFGKIIGYFENDDGAYEMEVVGYGSYDPGSDYSYYYHVTKENDQADLAILKITGTQPDNTAHPSLKIASDSNQAVRGSDIAVIGNPEGIGSTNSIAIGTISQTGITISSWGAGTFTMTDAAINGGNSGGPMVDISGRVVGVVESKLVATDIENMGFALDSKTLNEFISWVQSTYSITINYQTK